MLRIKNKGETKSLIYNNGRNKTSKIKWDANYDGKNGVVSLDISDDNKNSHVDVKFDNNDLAQIFNIPSEKTSLDRRLLRDFGMTHAHSKKKINAPMVIELIHPSDTEDDISREPLLFTSDNNISAPLNDLLETRSYSNISRKNTNRRRLSQKSRSRGKEQIIIPLKITSRIRNPSYLKRKTKYVTHGKKRIISKNITIRI